MRFRKPLPVKASLYQDRIDVSSQGKVTLTFPLAELNIVKKSARAITFKYGNKYYGLVLNQDKNKRDASDNFSTPDVLLADVLSEVVNNIYENRRKNAGVAAEWSNALETLGVKVKRAWL